MEWTVELTVVSVLDDGVAVAAALLAAEVVKMYGDWHYAVEKTMGESARSSARVVSGQPCIIMMKMVVVVDMVQARRGEMRCMRCGWTGGHTQGQPLMAVGKVCQG